MILPHRGWILIEVGSSEKETKAGLVLPDNVSANDEPMFGKVLRIGKPLLKEGGIVEEQPTFVVGANEEGLGGRVYKLKIGDTIIFKRLTQHELYDNSGTEKIAFVNFDSILGVEIPDEGEK